MSKFFYILLALSLLSSFACEAETTPHYVFIVDTGYDICMQQHGNNCKKNKNLLIRGSQPIALDSAFNPDNFRQQVFNSIEQFNHTYQTQAVLPTSLVELKNYRIVIINLLYGYGGVKNGKAKERQRLLDEFAFSAQPSQAGLPAQHVMYGLTSPFDANQYAFEWWPITLFKDNVFAPPYTMGNINWPNDKATPAHSYLPTEYKPIDLPYLITNHSYAINNTEDEAKSIIALLATLPADGHPLLIFYHCVAGKDRTGVVTMAYYMSYGGYPPAVNKQSSGRSQPMTANQAVTSASIQGMAPNGRAQRLAKLYSDWLAREKL